MKKSVIKQPARMGEEKMFGNKVLLFMDKALALGGRSSQEKKQPETIHGGE